MIIQQLLVISDNISWWKHSKDIPSGVGWIPFEIVKYESHNKQTARNKLAKQTAVKYKRGFRKTAEKTRSAYVSSPRPRVVAFLSHDTEFLSSTTRGLE